MNVNAFLQKDYENEPPTGPKKTNPIKANLFKGQNEQKNECFLENGTAGRYSANCVLLKLIGLLTFF